jgi:GNAT superfamily N-acetyltransferase
MSPRERLARPIQPPDVDVVVGLVHDLARYEHAADECQLTADQLRDALFGQRPALYGHVALAGDEVAGCALWFLNFSTWRGVHGIYIEDLYVQPAHRGKGLGRALLTELARVCEQRGYGRLEWSVLNWNEPAIGFYAALGAQVQSEWSIFRLSGPSLTRLARS